MGRSPPNEFALTPEGVEKWAPVYDRLIVTALPSGFKRLRVLCGDMAVYDAVFTFEQAQHLSLLLVTADPPEAA